MKAFVRLFFVLINLLLSKIGFCNHWEYKLMNDLLINYNPTIRPSVHHNNVVNVTFGLALTQIIDIVGFH
jgi:hypothetical protein